MTVEEKLREVAIWINKAGAEYGVASCGSTENYIVDVNGDGDFGEGVVSADLGMGSEPGTDVYQVREIRDGKYGDEVLVTFSEGTISAEPHSSVAAIGELILQRALNAMVDGD